MRCREFIAGLGSAPVWPFARPLAAEAQRRLGALQFGRDDDPVDQSLLGAFREGWRLSAGSKAATCGLIIASAVIPAVSLRVRRN
jgi:hypothetical protein